MPAMVRKQVYIEPGQNERLKMHARALGVTEAELIRRGIDAVAPPIDSTYGKALRETADASVYSLRARSLAERARGWTRGELYEDRYPRYLAEADRRSWDRALSVMREHVLKAEAAEPAPAERGWSREDAYVDRETRLAD
jgi:hypothetical protein